MEDKSIKSRWKIVSERHFTSAFAAPQQQAGVATTGAGKMRRLYI
jgi:hypothetical protein